MFSYPFSLTISSFVFSRLSRSRVFTLRRLRASGRHAEFGSESAVSTRFLQAS